MFKHFIKEIKNERAKVRYDNGYAYAILAMFKDDVDPCIILAEIFDEFRDDFDRGVEDAVRDKSHLLDNKSKPI